MAREDRTTKFNLPELNSESKLEVMPMIVQEELKFDKAAIRDLVFERYPTLNAEHKYIHDQVADSVINKNGKLFCLKAKTLWENLCNQTDSR